MKKALSLMTAAALVLSLAACGSTASSAASSEAASSETASSDAASSEAASSEAASETETAELPTVEPGKLIMSTDAAFPPYEMTTDSGEFEGIDIETAQAIADKLGLELQIDDMTLTLHCWLYSRASPIWLWLALPLPTSART